MPSLPIVLRVRPKAKGTGAVLSVMRETPFAGMSVDSMRPPTRSRAPALWVATVAMSLGIGGMLWWKLGSAKAAPPASAPPVAATAQALLERPPPPPPPPQLAASSVVESPETKSSTPARAGALAPSSCQGRCTGSASADLQKAVRAKAGAARSCYERALRQNAMLQGRMTVAVRVGPQGRICGASVVSNGLGDAGVASCVVGMLRSGSVPAPSGGCVDLQVPLNFVARQ
jgi:hypothetical protein